MNRVVFYGYSDPGMVAGMEGCGWEVLAGEQRNWFAWAHGNLASVPKGGSADFGHFIRSDVQTLKPHLVVVGKGFDSNCPDPGADPPFFHVRVEDLAWVRKQGAIVVYLTLDDPNDLGFAVGTHVLSEVDAIGTCCVGTRHDYADHSAAPVFEFWPAWDQVLRLERDRMIREEHRCDVVFVGTPYTNNPDGSGPSIARRDVALAALDMDCEVHVFGKPAWTSRMDGGDPRLESCYRGEARWEDLHHIFRAAKVTYNSFIRQGQRYANDRIPIAGGAGGFLLMEDQLFLGQEFAEGLHVGYHRRGNLDSFRERLAWWLAHDAERTGAAERMRALVHGKHTMAHRAVLLTRVYEEAAERRRASQPGCCR